MHKDRFFVIYLKKYRERADLTQGKLAERLGISRQSVIALEGGKCIPSVNLAAKIARFFELPIEFIFRFDGNFETQCREISNIDKKKGDNMARDLMPWSPWREMMSLRENIDKFFEEPTMSNRPSASLFHPAVGIRETEKELVVEADLPGVKEEDVEIEIEDDKLIIKGERKHSAETKREDYYHLESSYGSFSRVVGLPSYVNAEKAVAEIKDGTLMVKFPKVEKRKPKKVQIKAKAKKIQEIKKK